MKQGLLTLIVFLGCVVFFTADASASFVHYKQPNISSVSASTITTTSATITWLSAVASDSQVQYGTTADYGNLTTLDTALTRSHIQIISGLAPNTLYHYEVMSRNSSGTLYTAGDFTFSTQPVIVTGMIANVNVSGISATSVVISWDTTAPANSLVEYGANTRYGLSSPLAPEFVTSHSVVLSGLFPDNVYHFRVRSADAAGNLGISDDATFTTTGISGSAVFISVSASAISSDSVTITWVTAYAATSQVEYGTSASYGSSTALDPKATVSHTQTLVGLAPNTLYHYRVLATGGGEDPANSADYTFKTATVTLFYPQLNLGPDSYTGVAVANLDAASGQISFTAFEATGWELSGSGLTDPAYRTLGSGAQMALIQNQLFGPGISGVWPLGLTMVDSFTPHVAGFFIAFDSALSLMDGAGLTSRLLSSFVLPETGSQDYSTVFFGNPNSQDAAVTLELVETDGTVRSSIQASIPAFGTYSADLLTGTFAGIDAAPSDYVRITSSQGLVPYELLGNVGKDVAVLAGQDAADAGTTLYSPQFAVGGVWNSTLSIVNQDSAAGTVTLQWIGDDGKQIGNTQVVSITAGGKLYISDPSFFQAASVPSGQITEGYVQVVSSGIRISGSVVFSDAAQGAFITALPLVSALQNAQVLSHVASDSTYFTGLSILNPNPADANVTIDLYSSAGQLDKSITQLIPRGQRLSRLLTEVFPDLAGQARDSGYIKVTSDQGVACFGVFGTHGLSVLSAIPAQPVS